MGAGSSQPGQVQQGRCGQKALNKQDGGRHGVVYTHLDQWHDTLGQVTKRRKLLLSEHCHGGNERAGEAGIDAEASCPRSACSYVAVRGFEPRPSSISL